VWQYRQWECRASATLHAALTPRQDNSNTESPGLSFAVSMQHKCIEQSNHSFDILHPTEAAYGSLSGKSSWLPVFSISFLHDCTKQIGTANALTVARSKFETKHDNRTRKDGGIHVHSARFVIVYAQTI